MSDDGISDAQKVQRAEEAARLLENPMLQEAFAAIEMNLTLKWARSADDARDEREFIFLQLRAVRLIRGYLNTRVQDGKIVLATQAAKDSDGRASAG